jgi:hypothetical protein
MRCRVAFIALLLGCAAMTSASAASCKIVKVLPQLLDEKGRHTKDPSLYARDAYQAFLRKNPDKCSGVRFAVQWKARIPDSGHLKLRVEVRGSKDVENLTLEQPISRTRVFDRWSYVPLTGEQYKKTGEVTAWRATLWDGDRLLAEQRSFLW